MSAAKVIVELLKAIPAIIGVFRKPKPLTPREDVKPLSTHPSATIVDAHGNRKDF